MGQLEKRPDLEFTGSPKRVKKSSDQAKKEQETEDARRKKQKKARP